MSISISELLPERLDWSAGLQADALAKLPGRPGVWLLLAQNDLPVLAATSQNIRASVTGRLSAPDPAQRSKKTDLSTTVISCRYIVTYGRFESDWLFGKLIYTAWPGDFWEHVGFAPMWMLKAAPVVTPETTAAGGIMRLQPTTSWPGEPEAIVLGPLAARSDAQDLADTLTDLFDLCRYWQILVKAPHGTPCAYHEMGRSPAPCAGLIPMEQYNQMVREGMAFAGPQRAGVLRDRQMQMHAAAASLQFERASQLKSWLQRADVLDEARFQYLADVRQLAGLVVSKFRTQARPFYFRAGIIEAGEPVRLSKIDEHLAAWRERLNAEPAVQADDPTRQWQSGLLATHLFRPQRKDLAWLPAGQDMPAWLEAVKTLQSTPESQ